ncbi:MAG TPA: phospholipase D family protein [Saprospiraceae bacterium]|nr:phospholipase D family protein [Saprospiraceae bacterium]
MAEFLNTDKLKTYLIKIIETADRELIFITPYIQTSPSIIDLLTAAANRGVSITIVYKEGNINESEKQKLVKIDNLNLLSHPNLHAKCFYNEKYLIIGSLNLYDYSQRNNREMGVLFRRTNEESKGWDNYKLGKDDDSIFQDAISEIKSIITASNIEKESSLTMQRGFEFEITKTSYDIIIETCNKLNKYSKNKKFVPYQSSDHWYAKCENFLDRINIVYERGRVTIELNFEESRLQDIFKLLNTKNNRYEYRVVNCFRMYWTYLNPSFTLYALKDHKLWDLGENDEFYSGLLSCLNEVMIYLKPVIEKTKK